MKFFKNEALILSILISPLLFLMINWGDFPDSIPIHFNIKGVPDRYGSKAFGLLLIPGLNIGLYFLFLIIPKIDPSRKNYEKFIGVFRVIRTAIHIFLTFVFGIIAAFSLGYHFNISLLIFYGVLLLFLVMGNYLGSVQHNYFIGVRTPWTLANDQVWRKTHRLTAKLWVSSSILVMIILPFISRLELLVPVFIAIIAGVPVIYSYIIFRKMVAQ
jgi:uncharacterized membrane protein